MLAHLREGVSRAEGGSVGVGSSRDEAGAAAAGGEQDLPEVGDVLGEVGTKEGEVSLREAADCSGGVDWRVATGAFVQLLQVVAHCPGLPAQAALG